MAENLKIGIDLEGNIEKKLDLLLDKSKNFGNSMHPGKNAESEWSNTFKKIGGFVAGAFTIEKIEQFGKEIYKVREEFGKYEALLTNSFEGNKDLAKKTLSSIEEFGEKSTFSVKELTESFVEMRAKGFTPTTDEMKKMGDLAASQNKSFSSVSEAFVQVSIWAYKRIKTIWNSC